MAEYELTHDERQLIAHRRRAQALAATYHATRYPVADPNCGREPVICGLAAPFFTRGIAPDDWGGHIEILPGAFQKAIQTQDIDFLLDHSDTLPVIASTRDRTLHLWESAVGLAFRAQPDTFLASEVFRHLARGALGTVSIGWLHRGAGVVDSPGLRSYIAIDLTEVSLLPTRAIPRFPGTWARVMPLSESWGLENASTTRVLMRVGHRLSVAGEGAVYGADGGYLFANEAYALPCLLANSLIQHGCARALKG